MGDHLPNYNGNAPFAMDVLDHGYVALRNIAGPTRRLPGWTDPSVDGDQDDTREFDADDTDIANAARMSFDGTDGDRPRELDLNLADYLMKNAHWSPFEMIEVWLEMKLPIFVARQFVRHTASINEISGRYVKLPEDWYIPTVVGGKAKSNKQGQEDNLDADEQEAFRMGLDQHCRNGYKNYEVALSHGVAPEHARMFLSLNHYTKWLWKSNLRDMLMLLRSRLDGHAQIESRAYAGAIEKMLRTHLPHTMDLFDKYLRQ